MLVASPYMTHDILVKFRSSMRKFDSQLDRLEILNVSRPLRLHTNRQMLVLLSALGVTDEVVLRQLDVQLQLLSSSVCSDQYVDVFIDTRSTYFINSIHSNLPIYTSKYGQVSKIHAG